MRYVSGLSRARVVIAAFFAVLVLFSVGCQTKFRNGGSSGTLNASGASGEARDTTAPASPSVVIMNGAANVYTTAVTVNLSATETASLPVQMCVAEANDCSTCSYEAFSATKALVLGGSGVRKVSAKFRDALGNESACVSDTINVTTLTVVARYAGATNWNDYATAADPSIGCTGAETGNINDCVHGGPARKVVTAETSCANLTMTDSLGIFDWTCGMAGTAVFYSTLKSDKGLGDLLQDSTNWKANLVTIYLSGSPLGSSAPSTWWTNVLCGLVSNNGSCTDGLISCSDSTAGYSCAAPYTAVLNKTGTIYSIGADQITSGYNIGASKIGVVTRGTSTLTFSPNDNTNASDPWGDPGTEFKVLIAGSDRAFLWIEGRYNGATRDVAASDGGTFFFGKLDWSVFRNVDVRLGYRGITVMLGNHDFLSRVRIADTGSDGLWFHNYDSSYGGWRIDQVAIYNTGGVPLMTAGSSYNVFTNLTISGATGVGLQIDWGDENYSVFANITILNSQVGLWKGADHAAYNDIFHNILISNGAGNGCVIINPSSDTFAIGNTWSQVAISNAGDQWGGGENAFNLDHVNGFKFTGNFLLGLNANRGSGPLYTPLYCMVTNGTSPGMATDGSCSAAGASDWNIVGGVSFLNSFVGKVSSDSSNASGTTGTSLYNLITDFWNFANWWRVWALDGSAFANPDNIGQCSGAATCRIWDAALRATDTVIRNTTGNGSSQNQTFTSGATCPTQVAGSQYLDSQTFTQNAETVKNYGRNAIPFPDSNSNGNCDAGETCKIRYLKAAIEISGNGNGLCESGETCLYTPNFGAYQGHGPLQQCLFQNGTISGVTMFGYQTNGY